MQSNEGQILQMWYLLFCLFHWIEFRVWESATPASYLEEPGSNLSQKIGILNDTSYGFLQCLQEKVKIESQSMPRPFWGSIASYSDGNRIPAIHFVANNFTD
jgi:hypothetical protein